MKKPHYVYRSLDDLINNELNPQLLAPMFLNPHYVDEVKHRVADEKKKILAEIKDQVFALNTADESRLMITRYYNAVVVLIGRISEYQYQVGLKAIETLKDYLANQLNEILQFFEREFPLYLTDEKRVPITRLLQVRAEIAEKMDYLMDRIKGAVHGEVPVYIIRDYLQGFIGKVDRREMIKAHELNFTLEMIRDIEHVDMVKGIGMTKCPVLNELLVYWNMNSKETIAYFVNTLDILLKQYPTQTDQVEFLKYEQKRLLQVPEKPNSAYDRRYPNLRAYLLDYVANEIVYRENRMVAFAPIPDAKNIEIYKSKNAKVLVDLSSDQLGLLLRAADEMRLLVGRSMRSVFKAIVPFLSTPYTEEPSWDNMRTKSYGPEDRDKEVVIGVLEKLIKKVASY
jgi:hypothetical protein